MVRVLSFCLETTSFTLIKPPFYLSLPLLNPFLPLFNHNLASASLRISSHSLETTVYRPLDIYIHITHHESFPKQYPLGQESCRTKVSRIFRYFVPNFAPNFAPNFPRIFSRIFRASFRGKQRPEKIHQKSPPFFNAKFPGAHEKNIHKILLESRQSKYPGAIHRLHSMSWVRVAFAVSHVPMVVGKIALFISRRLCW